MFSIVVYFYISPNIKIISFISQKKKGILKELIPNHCLQNIHTPVYRITIHTITSTLVEGFKRIYQQVKHQRYDKLECQ